MERENRKRKKMMNNNLSDSYLKALNEASQQFIKPPNGKHVLPDPNNLNPLQPQPHQPPVYNVSKENFKELVQRLTGMPKPNNPKRTRLQRIRPPPLAPINKPNTNNNGNNKVVVGSSSGSGFVGSGSGSGFVSSGSGNGFVGSGSGMLPPLPSVHHASESPVSAYMRDMQNNTGPTNDGDDVAKYMRFLQNSAFARDVRPPTQQHQQPQQQQQHFPSVINNNEMDKFDFELDDFELDDFDFELEMESLDNATAKANANANANGNGNQVYPTIPASPLPFGGCLKSPNSGMPLSPLSPGWNEIFKM